MRTGCATGEKTSWQPRAHPDDRLQVPVRGSGTGGSSDGEPVSRRTAPLRTRENASGAANGSTASWPAGVRHSALGVGRGGGRSQRPQRFPLGQCRHDRVERNRRRVDRRGCILRRGLCGRRHGGPALQPELGAVTKIVASGGVAVTHKVGTSVWRRKYQPPFAATRALRAYLNASHPSRSHHYTMELGKTAFARIITPRMTRQIPPERPDRQGARPHPDRSPLVRCPL